LNFLFLILVVHAPACLPAAAAAATTTTSSSSSCILFTEQNRPMLIIKSDAVLFLFKHNFQIIV
jgi:hypothetical protein